VGDLYNRVMVGSLPVAAGPWRDQDAAAALLAADRLAAALASSAASRLLRLMQDLVVLMCSRGLPLKVLRERGAPSGPFLVRVLDALPPGTFESVEMGGQGFFERLGNARYHVWHNHADATPRRRGVRRSIYRRDRRARNAAIRATLAGRVPPEEERPVADEDTEPDERSAVKDEESEPEPVADAEEAAQEALLRGLLGRVAPAQVAEAAQEALLISLLGRDPLAATEYNVAVEDASDIADEGTAALHAHRFGRVPPADAILAEDLCFVVDFDAIRAAGLVLESGHYIAGTFSV
jgi:hypothetical protein